MTKTIVLVAAVALLAVANSAHAQYQDWVGPGAAIDASYYDTDFAVGNGTYDTNVTRIGAAVAEHFTPDFALMIGAGYASLGMSDNAVAAPFSPTGYYARVGAHYDPALFSSNFGLSFRVGADYQRVNDSKKSEDLVYRWWTYTGSVGPWVRVGSLTLEGGIVYRRASGDQDLSGKISSTENLDYANSNNYYLGLTYDIDPDWNIALHLEGGGRQEAAVAFGYHFSPF